MFANNVSDYWIELKYRGLFSNELAFASNIKKLEHYIAYYYENKGFLIIKEHDKIIVRTDGNKYITIDGVKFEQKGFSLRRFVYFDKEITVNYGGINEGNGYSLIKWFLQQNIYLNTDNHKYKLTIYKFRTATKINVECAALSNIDIDLMVVTLSYFWARSKYIELLHGSG